MSQEELLLQQWRDLSPEHQQALLTFSETLIATETAKKTTETQP